MNDTLSRSYRVCRMCRDTIESWRFSTDSQICDSCIDKELDASVADADSSSGPSSALVAQVPGMPSDPFAAPAPSSAAAAPQLAIKPVQIMAPKEQAEPESAPEPAPAVEDEEPVPQQAAVHSTSRRFLNERRAKVARERRAKSSGSASKPRARTSRSSAPATTSSPRSTAIRSKDSSDMADYITSKVTDESKHLKTELKKHGWEQSSGGWYHTKLTREIGVVTFHAALLIQLRGSADSTKLNPRSITEIEGR